MGNVVCAQSAVLGSNVLLGEFVVIKDHVVIGDQVTIGNHVVIHAGTKIGSNVEIADKAILGKLPQLAKTSTAKREESLAPLVIGSGCRIGAGAVIYAGTIIEQEAVIADLASIRERCRIGERTIIGRGVAVENDTVIGAETKIQTGAYITAYMVIEDHVFIAPMVQTTNDNFMGRTEERLQYLRGPQIKRGARIGGGALLLPGVRIAEESFIAAGALVTKDTEKKTLYMGVPARPIRKVREEELLENQ